MSIKSTHPNYGKMLSRWQLCCDSYDGEEAIKDGNTKYLPATSGQIEDGANTQNTSLGAQAYAAYKLRAVYPDLYREAVEAAIGVMHREPPTINLPTVLEDMRLNSTLLGESLEMLLRKINARQLITGRLGLMGDLSVDQDGVRPVIAIYNELAIRNWNDAAIDGDDVDINLVVLDESGYEMASDMSWSHQDKYRVLGLVDDQGDLSNGGVYGSALFDKSDSLSTTSLATPSLSGQTLDQIPFVFVNTKDLSPLPDVPPLDGLARLCLAIYRGEADYRQNLFSQGQDTLVLIGSQVEEDEVIRTGAGAKISVQTGGDVKYVGVSSQGLPEQRQALESDYQRAAQKSGRLIDTGRSQESGEALKIRIAAQTATLPQIAKTGAAALERILKLLATWHGANPDEVSVTPNLNFADADLNGQTLIQIVQAKGLGAPISEESIHEWMQNQGLTDLSYEDELNKLAMEEPAAGSNIASPIDQ